MEISILVHFPVSLLGIYKKKKAIPTENKFKLFLESKCIEVNLTEATCAALFFVISIRSELWSRIIILARKKRLSLLCASASASFNLTILRFESLQNSEKNPSD